VFKWQTRIMMQPGDDQRRRRESEFLGAEQRRNDHIPARLDARRR
jgi:hypothetical protein